MLYSILQHAHSGLRWIVLLLLLWTIIAAFKNWKGGAAFSESDRKRGLFTMIAAHVQLLLGLVLYFFISPFVQFTGEMMKDPVLRFYSMEHILLMLISILLITLGYTRLSRKENDTAKFKTQFYFLLIALVLMLAAIPWPFRPELGGTWF